MIPTLDGGQTLISGHSNEHRSTECSKESNDRLTGILGEDKYKGTSVQMADSGDCSYQIVKDTILFSLHPTHDGKIAARQEYSLGITDNQNIIKRIIAIIDKGITKTKTALAKLQRTKTKTVLAIDFRNQLSADHSALYNFITGLNLYTSIKTEIGNLNDDYMRESRNCTNKSVCLKLYSDYLKKLIKLFDKEQKDYEEKLDDCNVGKTFVQYKIRRRIYNFFSRI